jgi:hypothetical protein
LEVYEEVAWKASADVVVDLQALAPFSRAYPLNLERIYYFLQKSNHDVDVVVAAGEQFYVALTFPLTSEEENKKEIIYTRMTM